MTDKNDFQGSQESLPLSPETYLQLFNEINSLSPDAMNDMNVLTNNTLDVDTRTFMEDVRTWSANILLPAQQYPMNPVYVSSSLPGIENWPGNFGFKVSFPEQEVNKGSSWCYSRARNKLYVKKDVPCPVNFSTQGLMTDDVYIRAMAYFSSPTDASEIVVRCINHSIREERDRIPEANHLVRCESRTSYYEIDQNTRRHSVLVPFENPPAGQIFSSYNYKFVCLTSCPGGPNRRPMMMVFTLEKGNNVIGRQRVDLRVCACPVRDMLNDDGPKPSKNEVKKRKMSNSEPKPSTKKAMKNEVYLIKVHDKKCYEFLKWMKKCYHTYSFLKQFNPNIAFSNSSDEVSSDEKGC